MHRWLLQSAQVAILVACALCSAPPAYAVDYEPIPLECMVGSTDSVVVARLPSRTAADSYRVKVTDVVTGDAPKGELLVVEPARWRGTPPEFPTAQALLFLKRNAQTRWEVLGPSGEGRLALDARSANTTGLQLPLANASSRPDRAQLIDALRASGQCFQFRREAKRVSVTSRCEAAQVQKMMARSELHRALLQRLTDATRSGLACVL